MLEKYNIHTDLALEDKERFEADNVEVQGVVLEEEYDEEKEIRVTKVKIETENGAKIMRKPVGTYITIEAPNMHVPEDESHEEIAREIAKYLKEMIPKEKEEYSALVIGLGNRQVTPDALGPYVVENLIVTRHIIREYGKYAMGEEKVQMISAISPGVMAQTGMESAEIVKGIVQETKPDFVVAIDALAARNTKRLNRTIQIADTGINPGAGVGNHRSGINKDTLGVPVIAIGVPTVVDAATIVNDTMENFITALGYDATEKYELIKELISPHLHGLFVTPKDIGDTVESIGDIITEGLNILFHDNI